MTIELWKVIIAASIPSLLALIGSIGAILFAMNERKARVMATNAETRMTHAEIDAMSAREWEGHYREMCRRLDKLEEKTQRQDDKIRQQDSKIDKQDNEIKGLRNQLDIAKQFIQYLWAGAVANLKYMREQGLDEPPFKPDRSFRGDDEFDDLGWDWLEEHGTWQGE